MRILSLWGGRRISMLAIVAFTLILTMLPAAALAAPAASGDYHKVHHGETLSEIAKHYGVTVWALAEANGISDPNTIYVGQHLYIPPAGTGYHGGGYHDGGYHDDGHHDGGYHDDGYHDDGYHDGGWKPAHYGGGQCSAWHYVHTGQTLSQIAKWYGSNTTAIAKVNGISNPSLIYAGQKLCIPSPYVHGGYGW
jgi:LysM repeat protein